MALIALKCNHLASLALKGLTNIPWSVGWRFWPIK